MISKISTNRGPLTAAVLHVVLALMALFPMTLQANGKPKPKERRACLGCTITGANPAYAGETTTYTLSGSCSPGASNWSCTGCIVNSYTSGNASISFGAAGTATIKATNPNGTLATLSVTVDNPPALNGGTISTGTQTINYNATPGSISASLPTGGGCQGAYTYQWWSSPNGSAFTEISGATGSSYQPGALTADTWFERETICGEQTEFTTNNVEVIVYPQLQANSVTPSTEYSNYDGAGGELSANPSGGSGSYTYQWYWSNMTFGFAQISGATGPTYSPPPQTYALYYQVEVYSNGDSSRSNNYATVFVYQQVGASISPGSEATNYNTAPGQLTATGSGGNLSYGYQWYTNASGSFQPITNATSSTYQPPVLTSTTSYEVEVTSNGAPATSTPVTVTVYPQLVTGTISPSTQTINYGRTPDTLKVSGTTGGNGTYTYQWDSAASPTGPFTPINLAVGPNWVPPSLGDTTYFEVITTSNGVSVTSAPVTVNVHPEVFPPVLSPAYASIASGANPGMLTATPASGGLCSGSFSYQWQSAPDGVTWSNISSINGLSYSPGVLNANIYYRVRVICATDTEYSNTAEIEIATYTTDLNYIRERDLSRPGITDTVTADGLTSTWDVQQTTKYFDGLGRPIQTVAMQASPLGNDMVSLQTYDTYGRASTQYLPYTSPSNNGNYKTDPFGEQNTFNTAQFPNEQYYYGQVTYESSTLNRVVNTEAPGSSWVGSDRGVNQSYWLNAAADSVHIWNIAWAAGSIPTDGGIYPTGQLYKTLTTDAQGHQVIKYKDKLNQVVLKKVQVTANPGTGPTGWLCTYYVYDDLNLLRFVITPQVVVLIQGETTWTIPLAIANNYCYRYEYDYRKRMIIKKIPGAGEVHMVYDARDRMVMSQDSMLRSTKQWMVTTYDPEDRPDSAGLITDPTNYNNLAYHTAAAMGSLNYPPVQDYTFTVEVQNHYDSYAWVTALNTVLTATMDTSYNNNSTYFVTNYNSSPFYAVPNRPFMITRGMLTGETRYLLGTTQVQYSVDFYDDRARTIEVQSTNYTSGLDKEITQYDFSGQPLRHLLATTKNGNNSQTHTIDDEYTYDPHFRMTGVKDNIDGTLITVDTMQYDELGQLQKKTLGGGMDSLVYAYNVRGWVTGINKNFVGGTANDYFGMELAYDHQSSVSTTTYAAAQYTGNITGLIWKSAGDGINRKYDFTYDTAGRLTAANFLQNPSGSTWNTAAMNYTVNEMNYDANGNNYAMNQYGFKIGAPTGLIDQLQYHYITNSNQLSYVIDVANDTASTLGDYHYKSGGPYNYNYDGNGNLKSDGNKGIDSIGYNYLNLVQYVHFKGKGMIQYAYDTKGEKEAKIVTDSTQTPVKVTTTAYIKSCQYTNDTLAQVGIEEGRARWQKKYLMGGDSIYSYFYDYFLKDHLGNTRVILTTQKDTTQYIATMEPANRATENALFYNIDSTSYATNAVPGGYPGGTNGGANDSVAMVSGSSGDHTQGPAMILKVMAGDSVVFGVNSYYVGGGTTGNNSSSLTSVLSTLAGGLVSLGAGGGEAGTLSALNNTSGSPVFAALNSFLPSNDSTPASKPKAYLNWMLLDNQFNYVSGYNQSGALPVGSANVLNPLATTIKLHHSGYLYIWVSNETQNWMVFFDNLSIEHFTGPMIEENHYYPFGLAMAGISDKALKTPYGQNKYRYNGKELQDLEFSDGTGLEAYDFESRIYDPQIGRWQQIDPLAESTRRWSPYNYVFDNPLRYTDPTGMSAHDSTAANGEKVRVYDPEQSVTVTPKNNASSGVGNTLLGLLDYIPFVGSIKQIGMGIAHGNWKEAGIGVIMLGVDAVSGGEGGELIRVGEEVVEHGLEIAAEDEAKEAAEKEVEEIELHHSDPEFMGGDPDQELTPLTKSEHQELHKDLNEHLETYKDAKTGKTMRPKRGNSGQTIRNNFSRSQRLKALSDFYKGSGAKYTSAARDFFKQHPSLK